jgi:hypothetical protein
MNSGPPRKLEGELLTECAGWIWEQMQEEGFFLAGELVELVLETERELGIQAESLDSIARQLDDEFQQRGISGNPAPFDVRLILMVLDWEDDFLGFAGILREQS